MFTINKVLVASINFELLDPYRALMILNSPILVVNIQIVGPDERVIYAGERESSGKYTFAAHTDGVYQYCFGNQMSSMTPKIVMFSMDVGETPKDQLEGDGKGDTIP